MPNCGSTCDLTYHRGGVMQGVTNYLIFWLPAGYNFDNSTIDPAASNPSNARYEGIIENYFQQIGGSPFYQILQQYNNSGGTASLGAVYIDTTPYPSGHGTIANPLNYTNIDDEIASDINLNSWSYGLNSEFFLFTGFNVESCSAFGYCTTNNICGWHNYFTLNSSPVIYSNLPDDGERSGGSRHCLLTNFGAPTSGPNKDPFADAEVNTLSHEQFESVSDPLFTAWYYQNGSGEIGDLCNGYFGPGSGYIEPDGSDIILDGFINSKLFLVQMEWNNALSGCALDPTREPVQSTIQLTTCGTCSLLGSDDGFRFSYLEAGSARNGGFATATGSMITVFALSSTQLVFSAQSIRSNSTMPLCLISQSSGPDYRINGCSQIAVNAPVGGSAIYSYYELEALTFSATLIGGGSPTPPSINYTSAPSYLTSTYSPIRLSTMLSFTAQGSPGMVLWVLKGSIWNATALLVESSASERWISGVTNGTANSPATHNLVYNHQFYVSFAVSSAANTGSFSRNPSPIDGFYNAGTTISLAAQASAGYQFTSWSSSSGSITFGDSASSTTTASVNGAGTISASFQTPASPLLLPAAILVLVLVVGGAYVVARRRRSLVLPIRPS